MKNADFMLSQENLQWLIDSLNEYFDKEDELETREERFTMLFESQSELIRKIVTDL